MKLTARFVVLVLALLGAIAVTTWSGFWGLSHLDRELHSVVDGDMQRLLHVTHVRRLFRSMVVLERDHILEAASGKKTELSKKMLKARAELNEELRAYEGLALGEDLPQVEALREAFRHWVALDEQVQRLSSNRESEAAYALSARHGADPVQWETVISALIKTNEQRLSAQIKATENGSSTSVLVLLGAALMGAGVAIVAGTVVFQGIQRTMREVVQLNTDLEGQVRARTRALVDREASLRRILDNMNEGLVVVDASGRVTSERSKKLAEWFGAEPPISEKLVEYLFPNDQKTKIHFELGFQQLFEGILPFDVSAAQLPQRFEREGHTYALSYRPIEKNHHLKALLVVVSDLTATLTAERGERTTRETHALVGQLLRDRPGFRTFVQDGTAHILQIESTTEPPALMFSLHTLKGNAYVFGLNILGDACHLLETELMEGRIPSLESRRRLRGHWNEAMEHVEQVVGDGLMSGVNLSDFEIDGLVRQLVLRTDHEDILKTVHLWRAEPTSAVLQRLAAQTERVARALGKKVEVVVEDGGVYLPPGVFDGFWSAMVHVIRNAAFHGIEPSEERVSVGKPEAGSVRLESRVREDGRFEVKISDDGRGIDLERLRERAVALGIKPGQEASDVRLVFADGLSTAQEVSEIAGRGYGLSAVVQELERRGGRVSIDTEPGHGTSFRFSFPPFSPTPGQDDELSNSGGQTRPMTH